ncbi:valine--tRNA ligase [Candidatus Saccharibacteria bacterium]|nr:valine--tRNA ligase [Candidatus Saccharibacteria bacterium]
MNSEFNSQLDKAYLPSQHEPEVSELWEKAGAYKPAGDPAKEPFCIIMPPPNANGVLHAGHLMYTVEDIATRFARMQGRPTLWLPGTDHAGIETQYVYEKELAKKGLSRFDLGPEKFYDEVMEFTKRHQEGALAGFKSMGFSADWSKLKFTLDEDIIDVVYDVFIRLHKDGHIYRGNRIVNWCPRCQAAFPDIETEHIDRDDAMYTVDYGTIKIATTRPETIFADVAVAVNPKDRNYETLIGKTATIPLVDRQIPIIADAHVDPEAGTGALKVTPAHDKNDYEIGQRHNLPEISVIDEEGKLINVPEEFAGMEVLEARKAVVEALGRAGKLVKTDPLTHSVAVHDRCKTPIELLISEQWFLRVKELNKPVIEALENNEINIYPARYKRVALNWLNQEHDWCISRPGWWGIRIPVYYKTNNDPEKENYIIAKDEKEAIKYYGEGNYRAETDTFDTWFSSSQWPYATLMTSGKDDFKTFYPTSLMGTAAEILHKWVTRMVMFGLYATKQVPFKNVYLWGTVTDEKGQKLSKSKGNYEDPMEITAKYGTDALRMALSIGITAGNNGALYDEKVQGYRNFCNKLWNVARFILAKVPEGTNPENAKVLSPADNWVVGKVNETIELVTKNIESYRYSEAGQEVYTLLWEDIADKYIEYSKQSPNNELLAYCLDTVLRLAHPYAPFVTEAIWQRLMWTNSNLITEQWPNVIHSASTAEAKKFEIEIIKIISAKQKDAKAVEVKKLQKELEAKKNMIRISESKLDNKNFVNNAPKNVVEDEKQRLDQAISDATKLEGQIEKLKSN